MASPLRYDTGSYTQLRAQMRRRKKWFEAQSLVQGNGVFTLKAYDQPSSSVALRSISMAHAESRVHTQPRGGACSFSGSPDCGAQAEHGLHSPKQPAPLLRGPRPPRRSTQGRPCRTGTRPTSPGPAATSRSAQRACGPAVPGCEAGQHAVCANLLQRDRQLLHRSLGVQCSNHWWCSAYPLLFNQTRAINRAPMNAATTTMAAPVHKASCWLCCAAHQAAAPGSSTQRRNLPALHSHHSLQLHARLQQKAMSTTRQAHTRATFSLTWSAKIA